MAQHAPLDPALAAFEKLLLAAVTVG